MAWKTFLLQMPYTDGASTDGKTLEEQLNQIEANGYDIRFIFKESKMYTVLAKAQSMRRSGQLSNCERNEL